MNLLLKNLYSSEISEIERVRDEIRKEISAENEYIKNLLSYLSPFKGKLVRPALLLLTAKLFGEVNPVHCKLAAATELLHNATLLHDDVIDDAENRRSLESFNLKWGNEKSILVGDYLLSIAFKICSRSNNEKIMKIITDTAHNMCKGELKHSKYKFNVILSEEDYLKIISQKTATLFSTACKFGCIEVGLDSKESKKLEMFGKNFGVAFQIIDDCTDIVGDEEKAGKTLGRDLDKGKITLPTLTLFRKIEGSEREKLLNVLHDEEDVNKRELFKSMIIQTNVLSYCTQTAKNFISRAKEYIEHFPDSLPKTNLKKLADSVVEKIFN